MKIFKTISIRNDYSTLLVQTQDDQRWMERTAQQMVAADKSSASNNKHFYGDMAFRKQFQEFSVNFEHGIEMEWK